MTQLVKTEAIEKLNSFLKEGGNNADPLLAHMLSNVNSEFLSNMSNLHQQFLDFSNQSSTNGKMANNHEVVSDDGKMEQNEFIKAFTKVSLKDTIVSDGNDSETSAFSVINSENKVKNNFQ